jgi:DNA-binding transcriptional LysR family regulator
MNLSSLDLNLLRVLDALLSEGSTVGAGRKIGLSQPAVSAALGRLRIALSDPLFVRCGQGIEPTDYARALEHPLRQALDGLQSMLDETDSFDPARSDRVFRISGSDYYAEMLMPELAVTMSTQAPGVRVQLIDMLHNSGEIAALRNNELDIALLPQASFPDWLGQEVALETGFYVVASRGNRPVQSAGLAEGDTMPIDLFCALGHVLFSPGGSFHGVGDRALTAIGRKRRVVMTLPVFSGVACTVAESDLIALMPSQLALRLAARLNLALYEPPLPLDNIRISMIWHHRSTNSPAGQWLRRQVREILGHRHLSRNSETG